MSVAALTYSLAGTSIVSALIVTILNGLYCATGPTLLSHTSTSSLSPVALSAVSCVALVLLTLLYPKHIRAGQQCPGWKMSVFYFTSAYLLIAAGAAAGTMATSNTQFKTPLFIARFVFWEISVFAQGLYVGNLLVALMQKKPDSEWPRAYDQELKCCPESLTSTSFPARAVSDHYRFEPKTSSLRRHPRLSNRFSGETLRLQNTKEVKHASFDTASSTASSPEPSPIHDRMPRCDRDTRPLLSTHNSIRSMPSLRHHQDEMHASLDSLVRYPSPAASMVNVAESRVREDNIHPLFRPSSPSPPPTPTRGTMIKASPSAGQTINAKTVSRMRSARSLREQAMRTPSPLPTAPELDDETSRRRDYAKGVSGHMLAGRSRSLSQYERPYELHESPDEN